jgi:DNA-directed RNA polymerase specialized sigma24 family protein
VNKEISSLTKNKLPENATWTDVYDFLYPFATAWVSRAAIPSWRGQEDDIIEDVVQVAIIRTLQYVESAEKGRRRPISSVGGLSIKILRNYINDLRRKEQRLIPIIEYTHDQLSEVASLEAPDFTEKVIEEVTDEGLFRRIARQVATFPEKMKLALLVDLANRMVFSDEETPLQKAFREEGFQLEEYCKQPSEDRAERNRQAALLSMGYKKIAQEMRTASEEYFS